jgi:hypothetical protein
MVSWLRFIKIMKIVCVQGINYSPKGYRQGRLAML